MTRSTAVSLDVQLALTRVAIGIYSETYKGVKIESYEPPRGTVLHDLWHGRRLSHRHQEAWRLTVALFDEAAGVSPANTLSAVSGQPGASDGHLPRVWSNAAQEKLDRINEFYLHFHEKRLLRLLQHDLQNPGRIMHLDEIGMKISGYKDKAQARAAAAASIHRLLDSLAEFHGI